MIYFDYKKVFDKVAHHRLICKLKSFGSQCNIIQWIETLFTDSQQRVLINRAKSAWSQVTSGVPQESVIGPIFFLVYFSLQKKTTLCCHSRCLSIRLSSVEITLERCYIISTRRISFKLSLNIDIGVMHV